MLIVDLVYKKDLEAVNANVVAHRNFLDKYYKEKVFIMSGPKVPKNDRVYFGRYFEVTDEEGKVKRWIIVGEGETDFYEGAVSWKSIVGRALLNKRLGDVILVKRPAGEVELEVTKLL